MNLTLTPEANELIPTHSSQDGNLLVGGRDLHEFLESSERYSKWFERMLSYGFVEGVDYTLYQKVHPQNKQEITDHALTIEMAKEFKRWVSDAIYKKYVQ